MVVPRDWVRAGGMRYRPSSGRAGRAVPEQLTVVLMSSAVDPGLHGSTSVGFK